jgi:prevent-host-death family protein
METVPSAEFQRNIGHYQDKALIRPIVVTRNGRERVVLLSVDEFHRLKRRDRQVMTLADFTEQDIAALEKVRAPDQAAAFNHEVTGH